MTREEANKRILSITEDNILINLGTGFGKTALALRKIDQWNKGGAKVLVVAPYLTVIEGWKGEISKWGYEHLDITFVTYKSLEKYAGDWDVVVLDEGHHTSDRCQEILNSYNIQHLLILSATLKREHKRFFTSYCKPSYTELVISIREGIEDGVLPEPTIYLLPLNLNRYTEKCQFIINPKARQAFETKFNISANNYWHIKKNGNKKLQYCLEGNAVQYYNLISSLVEFYKRKSGSNAMRNLWLQNAGNRLKWLSEIKVDLVKSLLKKFKNHRVLTFCGSIEQSNKLDTYCVNSKVGTENLDKFNDRKIKHIAAVQCLDEGVNLTDCRISIFQMINSSSRLNVQRQGRGMRHAKPIFIFPYWVGTREEEILKEVLEGFKDVKVVTKMDDIKV